MGSAKVRAWYLFEFCDQSWIPTGARECLYEIMEACNSGVRSFNRQVARSAIGLARDHGLSSIIELGAGRAPVTTELTKHEDTAGLKLVPCDLVPNEAAYRKLEQEHAGRVAPIYSPVDLTKPQLVLNDSVLVMVGMMHHIPFELRPTVLRTLTQTNSQMAIYEPLRRTWLSILMTLLSFFPAIMLPITFFRRPGKLRRILWCWLIPIVPWMFMWDGVVSCLRQWHAEEWQAAFASLSPSPRVQYSQGFNSLQVMWQGVGQMDCSSAMAGDLATQGQRPADSATVHGMVH